MLRPDHGLYRVLRYAASCSPVLAADVAFPTSHAPVIYQDCSGNAVYGAWHHEAASGTFSRHFSVARALWVPLQKTGCVLERRVFVLDARGVRSWALENAGHGFAVSRDVPRGRGAVHVTAATAYFGGALLLEAAILWFRNTVFCRVLFHLSTVSRSFVNQVSFVLSFEACSVWTVVIC